MPIQWVYLFAARNINRLSSIPETISFDLRVSRLSLAPERGKDVCMSESEENSKPEVKIYSLSTCSHCRATKKFLGECTIKYEFVDVDLLEGEERKAIIEDVKKFNPRCSFPTIIIGDKVIVGFKEKEIKEALGL
jgi:glutaredoxin-like protein NrdH